MKKQLFFSLLCLCLALPAMAAERPLAGSTVLHATPSDPAPQKKTEAPKDRRTAKVPRANARALGADIGQSGWYVEGEPRGAKGSVWEKGIPLDVVARKRTVQGQKGSSRGMDTQQSIDSALKDLSEYERQPADGSATGLGAKGLRGRVTSDTSTWRNPVTEPLRAGEDVVVNRRNVVGAYADVVQSDDLQVTVGPELHITENDHNTKLTTKAPENSSLGVGMQFQWGF